MVHQDLAECRDALVAQLVYCSAQHTGINSLPLSYTHTLTLHSQVSSRVVMVELAPTPWLSATQPLASMQFSVLTHMHAHTESHTPVSLPGDPHSMHHPPLRVSTWMLEFSASS